jgi:protein-L-isoaspartate(D-aspartate) O-methyltransferase
MIIDAHFHAHEPYLHAAWIGSANPVGGEIVSLAMLVTKTREGFSVQPLRPAWFIPCVGASDAGEAQKLPSLPEARSIRSLWLKQDHEPNDTAVAIFGEVWFSSQTISQMAAAA